VPASIHGNLGHSGAGCEGCAQRAANLPRPGARAGARGTTSHELPDCFEISGSVGYSDLNQKITGEGAPDSYVDWRIGVAQRLLDLDFDLSYYDTNGKGEELYGDLAGARLVLSASKSF